MNDKNKKNKKIIAVVVAAVSIVLIFVLISTLSKNTKDDVGKKVIGKWQLTDSTSCDFLDDDLLRINPDNSLEGVSDFNTYKFVDTEGIDHLVFSGYGDSKRFEINFKSSNELEILEENVSDSLTCTFEKME